MVLLEQLSLAILSGMHMSSGNSDTTGDGLVVQYATTAQRVQTQSTCKSLLDQVLAASQIQVDSIRPNMHGRDDESFPKDSLASTSVGPLQQFCAAARKAIGRADITESTEGRGSQSRSEFEQKSNDDRRSALIELLSIWYGNNLPESVDELKKSFLADIARIDLIVEQQVNLVLHHPRFQKLEASWLGLRWLVDEVIEGANVRIRLLNVRLNELSKDLERAVEFDQSHFFEKVYEAEFGSPGGEPYGLLVGDFELAPGANQDHLELLRRISHTAAAAFAPFVCGTAPEMFGLSEFRPMERSIDYERLFSQKTYQSWRSFREDEDSRFVAMVLPRVLRRLPHNDTALNRVRTNMGFVENTHPDDIPIRFREDVSSRNGKNYLWGNAAYPFAGVIIRGYAESGWFSDIRGVQRDSDGGGLLTTLPSHSFGTDRSGLVPKTSTDVVITDTLEKTLSDQGFISLCHCRDTEFSAFYSVPSIQRAKQYDTAAATMNARISSMLQYMLSVSRFTHYLKCIVRDKVGSFKTPADCERLLGNWLSRYVTPDADASLRVKSARPLREASVQVREIPGKPGLYSSTIKLWPHYELDELLASVQLRTQVAQRRN